MPACNGAIPDPIIGMIAEEKRWRLLAMAARGRAEKVLFALARDEWPEEFDDHPIMAEALSLEVRADEVYDRIISTSANTLSGIVAKLEWGEGLPRSRRASSSTCAAGSRRVRENREAQSASLGCFERPAHYCRPGQWHYRFRV